MAFVRGVIPCQAQAAIWQWYRAKHNIQGQRRKAGLRVSDLDVIESNEAFAVQAMAVTKDLGLDPAAALAGRHG